MESTSGGRWHNARAAVTCQLGSMMGAIEPSIFNARFEGPAVTLRDEGKSNSKKKLPRIVLYERTSKGATQADVVGCPAVL